MLLATIGMSNVPNSAENAIVEMSYLIFPF